MSLLDELGLKLEDFARLPAYDVAAFAERAMWRRKQVREEQLPPPRDWMWRFWVLQGGRGSGKTRPAAEWVWWEAWCDPGSISHVIVRRNDDHRNVTFAGPSGLLSVIPPECIKKKTEGPWSIELVNASVIKGFTAAEPDTLRGPQCHRSWADELAGWDRLEDAWLQVQLSTRLKSNRQPVARICVSTTPKPKPVIIDLNKRFEIEAALVKKGELEESRRTIFIRRYSTYANAANLDPETLKEYKKVYEGTKAGRQELHAELIDPSEAGIIKRNWIRKWPAYTDETRTKRKELPPFDMVVISLDTAFTEKTRDDETGDPDPTACQVWGIFSTFKQRERTTHMLLLYAWKDWLSFPDLIKRVKDEMKERYGRVEIPVIKPLHGPSYAQASSGRPPDLILIEDKGSGISLRQVLEREGLPTWPYNPGNASKLTRFHAVSHLPAHGQVWMPESDQPERADQFMQWCEPVLEEWTTFSGEGSIAHDDHVDAGSQVMRYVLDKKIVTVTEAEERNRAIEAREDRASRPRAENPYAA